MRSRIILLVVLLVLSQLSSNQLLAEPTTAYQAEKVVAGWLRVDPKPLGAELGQQVRSVETFTNDNGEPIYYIVNLEPCGFVIVPADDWLEPIISFADDGTYDPSPDNPLGALATRDLGGRIPAVRDIQGLQATAAMQTALQCQAKWGDLESRADGLVALGQPSINIPYVDPLIQSKWAQTTCCTSPPRACYNYYTPQWEGGPTYGHAVWDEGNTVNYLCGCVATAMAQVMRYHQHPTNPIGQNQFSIRCWVKAGDNWYTSDYIQRLTRGGNGSGGAYNWSDMELVPGCSTTETQRKAIGALCYDAGLSVEMTYGPEFSGSHNFHADSSLTSVFDYANSIYSNLGGGIDQEFFNMVNSNLDAGCPVILSILRTGPAAHSIVCDGYGYDYSTMYHHLNMGWAGTDDAWYNLPNIDSSPAYTLVDDCIYNIFKSFTGEVISGHAATPVGDHLPDTSIHAICGTIHWMASTNDRGIYALTGVPSNSTCTIQASKGGYCFADQIVQSGLSADGNPTSGNVWGADFVPLSPQITSIAPTSGPPGTYMKIEGQYFCSDLYQGSVIFAGGATAQILAWSNDEILCRVPGGAMSGNMKVRTAVGYDSDGIYFEVTDPTTIYVDDDYTPNIENGTTGYPFSKIQLGIDVATNGDTVIVNPGTYYENINFNGKIISATTIAPEDPDIVASTIIDGGQNGSVVTFNSGEDPDCLLAGFTITNGYAENGGGVYCWDSCPTLADCNFTANQADPIDGRLNGGGGIYNYSGDLTVTNCTFNGNSSSWLGGGMYNEEACPTFINCTFSGNTAASGGGMFSFLSTSILTNCTFIGNSAYQGGGTWYQDSTTVLTNCIFSANNAFSSGGGMYSSTGDETLTNCTFSGNSAGSEGVPYSMGGGMYCISSPDITNCIFWGNSDPGGTDESAQIHGGSPSVNYCCIQGWTGNLGGTGNIGDDPNFVDGDNPDPNFRDYHLRPSSPCIDAGDNSSVPTDTTDLDGDGNTAEPIPYDLDEHPRILDGDCNDTDIVDMGAYEFNYAYMGDFDYDCEVDFEDFAIFALAWLTEQGDGQYNPDCDISLPADSYINWRDLKVLTDNWLAGLCN